MSCEKKDLLILTLLLYVVRNSLMLKSKCFISVLYNQFFNALDISTNRIFSFLNDHVIFSTL